MRRSFTQSFLIYYKLNSIFLFDVKIFDKCRINFYIFLSPSIPGNRSALARRCHLSHHVGVSELLLQLLLFALILNWKVKLEFGRKFFFRVKSIGKVDASNPAVSVNLKNNIFLMVKYPFFMSFSKQMCEVVITNPPEKLAVMSVWKKDISYETFLDIRVSFR